MDLFAREQKIYDDAVMYTENLQDGENCHADKYSILVKEYGKLLKQLRRITKMSDRTTVDLNTSKLDLLDKVHYDAMTGVYNRRFMEESLRRIIKSLSRSGGMLSVLMIDIDFFKLYNDTYGHSAGDECLKLIANALQDSITREDDFLARYGGEEFAVVLPNTDEIGLYIIANRMLNNVRTQNIPHEKNKAASHVTISIGGASGSVSHTQTGEEYIERADAALYASKRNGRNKYSYRNLMEGEV